MQQINSALSYRWLKLIKLITFSAIITTACSSTPPPVPPPAAVKPVSVTLVKQDQAQQNETKNPRLNINVVVFDPGIPDNPYLREKQGITKELRLAEASFLPFVLRDTLASTQLWGAIRVMPRTDHNAEFEITGKILKSNGFELKLAIEAIDSSGRVWLDKTYTDLAAQSDYAGDQHNFSEPFQDLFNQIANDLLTTSQNINDQDLQRIVDISTVRYAAELAPDAFDGYLIDQPNGIVQLNRLPARNDPILARIERIRDSEYRFMDTLDQHFKGLHERMQSSYYLWRKYTHDYTLEKLNYEFEKKTKKPKARRGLAALTESYGNFQETKYQREAIAELSATFNKEFSPQVSQVRDRAIQLNGSIDDRYLEWRRLMKEIYAQEVGLPVSP